MTRMTLTFHRHSIRLLSAIKDTHRSHSAITTAMVHSRFKLFYCFYGYILHVLWLCFRSWECSGEALFVACGRRADRPVMGDVLTPRGHTAAADKVDKLALSSPLPSAAMSSTSPMVDWMSVQHHHHHKITMMTVVVDWMSGSVIAAVVLGCLCLVVGIIYAYIYLTRINPHAGRSAAARLSGNNQSQAYDDGTSGAVSTHVFLFKKSWLSRRPLPPRRTAHLLDPFKRGPVSFRYCTLQSKHFYLFS